MRVPLVTALCALALAAPAHAQFQPGGTQPGACAGGFWTDLVGSGAADLVVGNLRPERIYGLNDADVLIGSHTRASCLFGGTGSDSLYLGRGGGVILGEDGRDLLVGSDKSDAMSGGGSGDVLIGGGAQDVLRGDAATDAMDAGAGDDAVVSDDGLPEIVDCGEGDDMVYADRADVLFGCERWRIVGRPLRHQRLVRDVGRPGTTFLAGFRSPERAPAGRYRVLVAAPACGIGPTAVAASPAMRRGERARLQLRPPAGGWCRGPYAGAIIRDNPCPDAARCPAPPPATPVAWLAFAVR